MTKLAKLFAITAICVTVACSSKTKAQDNLHRPAEIELPVQETVTGIVAVHENGGNRQVLIQVRQESKSVVSYEVEGAKKDLVASRNGKAITATGLVKNLSPFHKLIQVESIQ
jgi:hypothetical protein